MTNAERSRIWRQNNPEKMRLAKRRWYQNNRERAARSARDRQLLVTYGLSRESYDRMLAEQNGVCAICQDNCPRGFELSVDHCHKTGKIRGLLCSNCNTVLGKMRDDVKLLQRAIEYLNA